MEHGGYAKMTIAELARTAKVSAQTVYNSIGGKAEVVKAVWDVMLAGDDEPVAMSDRPEFRSMTDAGDLDAWAKAYAAWSRAIMERVGPLLAVLLSHGPGGDPVLQVFVATIDNERRTGNRYSLRGLIERDLLSPGADIEHLADAVWALTAPDVYRRLVQQSGWSHSAYEAWLAHHLRVTLDEGGTGGAGPGS
jgi:AcrR family transcriptional regulator